MFAMDGTPAREYSIAVSKFDKEPDLVNVVIGFDLFSETGGQVQSCGCPVEHQVYTLFEGNFGFWHFRSLSGVICPEDACLHRPVSNPGRSSLNQ